MRKSLGGRKSLVS